MFSINDNGLIKLIDLKTNTTTELLKYSDVRDVSFYIRVLAAVFEPYARKADASFTGMNGRSRRT